VSLQARASRVRLLLFDVDGVLTDGKILLHADGAESKRFDIKDGTALVWAQRVGLRVGFLSARNSPATAQRAAQLGITLVRQGVTTKLEAYEGILRQQGMTDSDVAYMGDDLLDLPVVNRAGLSAAPADAVDEVRSRVHFVSRAHGGNGAVRELIELVMRAQDRWELVLAEYVAQRPVADMHEPSACRVSQDVRAKGSRAGVGLERRPKEVARPSAAGRRLAPRGRRK
jgi:3-deoxy-D-manno-octulosonate 8-phosphate phosphatase (KDO 8-P phosphatase)